MIRKRALTLVALAFVGVAATQVPWAELTEADWIYSLATRFALVDGHKVHYPTPTAELAKLLEGRKETAALRHLADAKLNLGDRKGAIETMERWAAAEGPQAWDETARWAASHREFAAAFRAAEKALPGLPEDSKRALADLRIQWADRHPEQADPIALRKARSEMFSADGGALEEWVRALEKAGRLPEADQALAAAKAMTPERRLLLRSDLMADHGDLRGAFQVLDGAATEAWSQDFRKAYAQRVDKGASTAPATWRAALESRFDAGALVRLGTYFEGQSRADALADLLRQAERRYGKDLTRKDHLLMARLHGEIDAAPEAFRATLAAAHLGTPDEQTADLAVLARFALKAGSRPLAWGTYNDESYKWVASLDRTPGFWTGGLSFLLTGQDWKEPLDRLENDSLADRTFATARILAAELAQRSPKHGELAALRVAIMERHVARGEGQAALALLPLVETAPPAVADQGRRVALLAARQVSVPLNEEMRLQKARLAFLAVDGSRPQIHEGASRAAYQEPSEESEGGDSSAEGENSEPDARDWARTPVPQEGETYASLLEESLSRLEHLDPSHRASLDLILTEIDRLPDAEDLWLSLASRLEGWHLDDELGPRFDRALKSFQGPGIWDTAARWYARRSHHQDLRALAQSVADRFRGAEIFRKVGGAGDVRVEVPDQPQVGGRVRMVLWADWVRLKALERFPHSPTVFREAGSLVTRSSWQRHGDNLSHAHHAVVVPDSLMEERWWAILFADAGERETYFSQAMAEGKLEARLTILEQKADRTPVEDLLLFEGWARLSRFEQAAPAADRLAGNYPGDGALAQRVLSLHRSLNGLESSHAAQAQALVARTAPALEDPGPLWTELGEMEEDRGQPQAAMDIWKHLLDGEQRNPQRVSELATLLWDYNHDKEALAVVEEGRQRIGRPRFFAFETGVLRENVKDLEGAVREYLNALRPEETRGFGWFETDQRSLRRLAQLLSREKVYRIVERRIKALTPGVAEDERALAGFYPLSGIEPPAPGYDWDADAWIDRMDLPNDPVGRSQRQDKKAEDRPKEYDAIQRIGDLLLAKTKEMTAKGTSVEFLDAADSWSRPLVDARWTQDQVVNFQNLVLSRKAALAPSEEDRIQQEMARADFLSEKGRASEADAVWSALDPLIGALPEGSVRLRAEAGRAAYLERSKGVEPAAAEWRRITERHPWSLGLLDDRLAFLNRCGKGEEARAALEAVLPKAAAGHREAFLQRLTQDSLAASDLPRAHRAVVKLLAEESLDDPHRLGAIHLLARLSLKENPTWDPYAFAKSEGAKLKPELQAELYHELALAVDLEGGTGPVPGLWIEALNRRTERDWLDAAARSARRTGKSKELLTFFEKQHQRSPRDVRWAVAVRDIRRAFHDVDGALEAAKAAVTVRPEKENLWREAADLLVRADRVHEAADYLEGWNKPRAADENVARWRSQLYAQAGDGPRALEVEQAALAAYAKEAADDDNGLAERTARAAGRLFDLGYPDLALRIYSAKGDIRALAGSRVSFERQAQIALLTRQYIRLLTQPSESSGYLSALAFVLARHGRSEQREEVQAYLLRQIYPRDGRGNNTALNQWWPYIGQSGLEPSMRVALAQRLLAQRPGPWQMAPPMAYVERVSHGVIGRSQSSYYLESPDLERLWAEDLSRRDKGEELLGFLESRWQDLLRQVRGQGYLDGNSPRLEWAKWLDQPLVMSVWSRSLAAHPEKVKELSDLMGERRLWDRFWALAARHWSAEALVRIVPPETRFAWFRFWEPPLPSDPILAARRHAVEQVTVALERLLKGQPDAVKDPLIAKLRGPQTVGEVLGNGAQWVWPEFSLRRDAKGELREEGDDRIIGQGVDQGRIPGALWGDRPGEAWFVLEALARYRQGDHTAPLLALDVPQRGAETSRTLLSIRMARSMKDLPLAMDILAQRPGADHDRTWFEGKLSLLAAAGSKERAAKEFKTFLQRAQGKLTEEDYRWFSARAEDWGLVAPLDQLDPNRPVGPAFLAYLRDRRPADAARFTTADPSGYRAALTVRWQERESQLSAEQIRYWLKELWAVSNAPLPQRGLAALGGPWRHAAGWLNRQPASERLAAIKAMEEALNPAVAQPELFTLLSSAGHDDLSNLLAVRVHLARNESASALALVDAMLADLKKGEPLGYSVPERISETGDAEDGSEAPPAARMAGGDALVDRLQAWLRPFRDAKAAAPVEERFRALLKFRRQQGLTSLPAWRMAFQLSPAAETPGLAQELDEAWFRGEVAPENGGFLSEVIATALPAEAPRWLARWPREHGFEASHQRAAILVALNRQPEAARTLFEDRDRAPWGAKEELQAFDAWRRMGAPVPPDAKPPTYWTEALPPWQGRPEAVITALGARLKLHPLDVLSARAALRSPAAAEEETLVRAALALQSATGRDRSEEDLILLRLRTARGLLARSPEAAKIALDGARPEFIARLLIDRRMRTADIHSALSDAARIGRRTGDEAAMQEALRLLADRQASNLKALRAELTATAAPPEGFRLVGGRPTPIRPRDLTWSMLSNVIKAEGVQ